MSYRLLSVCLILLSIVIFFLPVSAAPTNAPNYTVTVKDAQWTEVSQGVYQTATSNENYSAEKWERPVEGDKFTDSGGIRTTTGKYYAYGDITEGQFAIDNDYLYVSIAVAGDFLHVPEEDVDQQGLKGIYYVYFDTGDPGEQFVMQLSDGSGLGSSFSTGDGKVYGPDFGNEYDGYVLWARANGLLLEFALDLSSLDLVPEDFEQLSWLYAGVAVSNPSSADLLPLMNTSDGQNPDGKSIEFDTLVGGPLSIPEPSSTVLLSAGCVCLLLRRTLSRYRLRG